jgi:hypothetical protein
MWPFRKKVPEAKHIWKIWEHTYWGDAIHIDKWEKNPKIYGWVSNPSVSLGDIFVSKMNSGKLCWFRTIELKYCADPRDMFFATIEAIGNGYVTEEEVETKVKELAPNMKVGWLI